MNPPALVIGGQLNGLSVCRSLTQAGIETYLLDTRWHDPASWSRYAIPIKAKALHGSGLLSTLRTIGLPEGTVLIITDEMAVYTISEHRDELAGRFRVHLPPHDIVLILHDKGLFHKFAVAHGLPVPNAIVIGRDAEVSSIRDLRFPVIIKPADKRDFHLKSVLRAVLASNLQHAEITSRKLLETTPEVIVQECIQGPDSNIYCCLFYRKNNTATINFVGRKLASVPRGTGSTALCVEVLPGDLRTQLEDLTEKFLVVSNYAGIGGIEYKLDARTQRLLIIEPTVGRTDWQEEIATLSGTNIPAIAYYEEWTAEGGIPGFAGCELLLRRTKPIPGVVWQQSYIDRIRSGFGVVPRNATVVDGYWRRDDPVPALVYYPIGIMILLWGAIKLSWRIVIVTVMLLHTLVASAAKPSESFVKATGTSFTIDGKPFFITGVNNHYLPYGTDTEVTEVLDDAVALGANVVRTFLQPVMGSLGGHPPTIWKPFRISGNSSADLNAHGNYLLYWDDKTNKMAINDGANGIQKIDTLIAEAKKRHLTLIIAFLDFWDYMGGIQQMAAWYGVSNENHSVVAQQHMNDDHFFFSDPRTIWDYQHWVEYVVNRMNPRTGLRYRDDPTIMAWDVANEANAKPDELRLAWTQGMAAYIKQLDHNHLVASGNANIHLQQFDISLPEIDFGTWHGYPKFLEIGVDQFDSLIPQYCDAAATYQKPVLLEEFGWARSNPNQAAAYAKWLHTLTEPVCAGWLVWRLVSRQADGRYPIDDYDQFDVRKDQTALWNIIHEAALRGREY